MAAYLLASPGVYNVSAEDYQLDCCIEPSLTKSIAHILLTRSPLHAWKAHPRLNPEWEESKDSKFDLGTAAHSMLLQGFDWKISVIDADHWRTKAAREKRNAAWESGFIPVLQKDYQKLGMIEKTAIKALASCIDISPVAAPLHRDQMRLDDDLGRGPGLNLQEHGKSEQTIIWQENGIWYRARPDWISHDRSLILDYKLTRASAHPDAWIRTMLGIAGDMQASFYLRGNAATGGPDAKFVFVVQELDQPYAVSFIGMPPAFIELGNTKIDRAIAIWKQCIGSGNWPGYANRIAWVDPPSWAEFSTAEVMQTSEWEKRVDEVFESGA